MRGIRPRYTGLDLCEPMVERCRRALSARQQLHRRGRPRPRPDGPYDFVVASGIFGLDAPGARERIAPTVEPCSSVRDGVAVNFLSRRAPRLRRRACTSTRREMLNLALQLTPAVRLDHSYLPNDFTLYLYESRPGRLSHEREPAMDITTPPAPPPPGPGRCGLPEERPSDRPSGYSRYAGKTVVAIGAHPDDLEIGIGGTLAKLQRSTARTW